MEYDVPYTAAQIMTFLGLKSKDIFRKLYLNPALERNLIAMKLLDKPTSRNQSYITYCTFMLLYKATFSHNTFFFQKRRFPSTIASSKQKSKPNLGLLFLFRIFNLSDIPRRNLQHVFAQLTGLRAGADHRAHAALLFGNSVQHLKRTGHIGVHAGRLLDLYGI